MIRSTISTVGGGAVPVGVALADADQAAVSHIDGDQHLLAGISGNRTLTKDHVVCVNQEYRYCTALGQQRRSARHFGGRFGLGAFGLGAGEYQPLSRFSTPDTQSKFLISFLYAVSYISLFDSVCVAATAISLVDC